MYVIVQTAKYPTVMKTIVPTVKEGKMYCKECSGNNAYPGRDVNLRQDILICPDCKCVTWPSVPELDELAGVQRTKERMRSIPNMPELEEQTND